MLVNIQVITCHYVIVHSFYIWKHAHLNVRVELMLLYTSVNDSYMWYWFKFLGSMFSLTCLISVKITQHPHVLKKKRLNTSCQGFFSYRLANIIYRYQKQNSIQHSKQLMYWMKKKQKAFQSLSKISIGFPVLNIEPYSHTFESYEWRLGLCSLLTLYI